MHGKGKMIFIDGGFYDGSWIGSYMHGYGELKFQNENLYEGGF